jgi:hypothetical protein
MARKMSQSTEHQKGRQNKAFAAIKTDLEEKERQKKRTRSKVIRTVVDDSKPMLYLANFTRARKCAMLMCKEIWP